MSVLGLLRRQYLTYKERISETVFSLFEKEPSFIVSWSHYLQLRRIENEDERSFYEIESAKSGWAVRTLQRQYNSRQIFLRSMMK